MGILEISADVVRDVNRRAGLALRQPAIPERVALEGLLKVKPTAEMPRQGKPKAKPKR
jgi:hypothetical protein